MPKKIEIYKPGHQILIDGELFPYLLAEEPVVEKVAEEYYQITFVIPAEEVYFTSSPISYEEDGSLTQPWKGDRFIEQDSSN